MRKRCRISQFNFKLTSSCGSVSQPLGLATIQGTRPVDVIPV